VLNAFNQSIRQSIDRSFDRSINQSINQHRLIQCRKSRANRQVAWFFDCHISLTLVPHNMRLLSRKRLNRSRCRSDVWLGWTHKEPCIRWDRDAPQKEAIFGVVHSGPLKALGVSAEVYAAEGINQSAITAQHAMRPSVKILRPLVITLCMLRCTCVGTFVKRALQIPWWWWWRWWWWWWWWWWYRPQKMVWLGSDSHGRRREDAYCSGWTSSSSVLSATASSLLPKQRLLAAGVDYACSNAFILLCVETSYRPIRRR